MLSKVPHIRIFLSSPMDVKTEREIVISTIRKLQNRLNVLLEVIAYDIDGGVVMLANDTPQFSIDKAIPKPCECHIVVTIFGDRLGTPFTDNQTGIYYESGTVSELLDALSNERVKTVIYRKDTSTKPVDAEKERLNDFFSKWGGMFYGVDGQAIRAYNIYESISHFEKIIYTNLVEVIKQVTDEDDVIEDDEMLVHNDGELLKWYYAYTPDKLLSIPDYEWNSRVSRLVEPIPQVLVINNSIKRIDIYHIKFVLEDEKEYKIPLEIKAKTDIISDAYDRANYRFHDSPLLRLHDFTVGSDGIILNVSKAYFKAALLTQRSLDYRGFGWDSSLRHDVHPTGCFEPLNQSCFPNTIGVNAIVFTVDSYLIIPMRSANVHINANKVAPSISGAADFSDVYYSNESSNLLRPVLREGLEELGLEEYQIVKNGIVFLGMTRDMLRGGKPELFFAIKLNISMMDIKNLWTNALDKNENKVLDYFKFNSSEYVSLDRLVSLIEYGELLNDVENILKKYKRNQITSQLVSNLVFWLHWKYPYH